jgi:L-2,4-diaminobutyric acid acetyltransferase
VNSAYAYVMWADHFAESSIVAVTEMNRVVGFVNGFRPPSDPTTLFVWQIAVAPEVRGRGVGGRMLDELLARSPARWLEATVTPSNVASAALFRGTATRHETGVEEAIGYPRALLPDDHEAEIRFRIGPLEATRQPIA